MPDQPMTLEQFNDLPEPAARDALTRCCGAKPWVEQVLARRPFAQFEDLLIAADEAFATLERMDWLQAFAAHPKIGEPPAASAQRPAAEWAADEQAGVADAPAEDRDALADANRAYAEKFGYIFIVNATGKSALEMLDLLNERLQNDAETELQIAATEQMKITHLRLHKLISDAV